MEFELNESIDERCEKAEANDISEREDRVVSKLLTDGAWNRLELEKLESLLEPVLRERERERVCPGWICSSSN